MEETQENTLYKLAYLEIQADRKEPGIWAMALAEADGNTAKAEARYIAKRVEQLRAKPSPEPAPVAIPTPQAVPPQVSPTKEEGSETAPGQAPIPWRKIGISTAIAVTVSCVTFVVDTPRRVTAAELFGMAMGPILLGLGLWTDVVAGAGCRRCL